MNMSPVDITKRVYRAVSGRTAHIRFDDVAAVVRMEAVCHDSDPRPVNYELNLLRRTDGALIVPLIDTPAAVIACVRDDAKFKSTIDYDARTTKHVSSIIDGVLSAARTSSGISIPSMLFLLPKVKETLRAELRVVSVEAKSIQPHEVALLSEIELFELEFYVPLFEVSSIMNSPRLPELIDVVSSLSGNGSDGQPDRGRVNRQVKSVIQSL